MARERMDGQRWAAWSEALASGIHSYGEHAGDEEEEERIDHQKLQVLRVHPSLKYRCSVVQCSAVLRSEHNPSEVRSLVYCTHNAEKRPTLSGGGSGANVTKRTPPEIVMTTPISVLTRKGSPSILVAITAFETWRAHGITRQSTTAHFRCHVAPQVAANHA